jgi:hypothetical protein
VIEHTNFKLLHHVSRPSCKRRWPASQSLTRLRLIKQGRAKSARRDADPVAS